VTTLRRVPLHPEKDGDAGQQLPATRDHFVLAEEDGFLCVVGEGEEIEAVINAEEVLVQQLEALAVIVHIAPQPLQVTGDG
jgi:hypothetical protein